MSAATRDRSGDATDPRATIDGAVDDAPTPSSFRPDIDALRAVGILTVIGYHGHAAGFRGGFVGVDVFFVISGFLITRNLLEERRRTGAVALRAFWGRRLRRLVPAMTVMVAATMVAGVVLLSPLQWGELAAQGTTATFYVSNWHFIDQSNAYFAAEVTDSPLLHTWSLSVEEQFYVVWPVLMAVVLAVGRRLRRLPTLPVVLALAAVGAASFLRSVELADAFNTRAYYGLASRTWEFAAAGLLAVAATRLRFTMAAAASWTLAVGGLALIGWATWSYDEATAFPGRAALVPVLGTLAVIAAGTWSRASWRLASAPAQWVGRISYSWYLWHWPFMVLAVAWRGTDSPTVRLVAGALSLPVAMASYRYVEDPVRRNRTLRASLPRTAAVAVAFTVLAAGSAVAVVQYRDVVVARPFYAELAAAAEKDYLDACAWSTTGDGDEVCTVGDLDAPRTVVVAGDSHAESWTPGFDGAGDQLGLRIVVRTKSNCPGNPVPIIYRVSKQYNDECERYHDGTERVIDEVDPELVVLVSSDFTRQVTTPDRVPIDGRAAQLEAWADALRTERDRLATDGIELGVVLDNPRIKPDPLACTEQEGDPEPCGARTSTAVAGVRRHIRNEEAVVGPEASLATVPLVCRDGECPVEVDGLYAWADATHLSADFTARHDDTVADFLQRFDGLEQPDG